MRVVERLLAVEIPVSKSRGSDRPSRRASQVRDLSDTRGSTQRLFALEIPVSQFEDLHELSESTRQELPVPPISGEPSMAEAILSASSRPESNSGSLTRSINARFWGILLFRRPRFLYHRRLLRRLRSSQWDLGRLFRFNRLTTTAQAALGANVGHVAVRSVGT